METDQDLPATVAESVDRDLPDPYSYDFHDRSTKLEPEYFDLARRTLAGGGSKHLLARMCGIDYSTLTRWFNRGERDLADDTDSRWAGFVRYANQGLAAFEAEQIQQVKNPEWLLERRFPESWGKKSQQDITVAPPQQYERKEATKEQKDFLQRLASGGIDESDPSSGESTPE